MASTSQKIKKIDYAIYNDPSLLPILVKDTSIGKGLIQSRFNRVISRRVGIEFELIGNLYHNYIKEHREITSQDQLAKHFGIYKYSEDGILYHNHRVTQIDSDSLSEIRVSITNTYQLKGLYKILTEMKRYCEIPIGGGIHIHIDFSKYKSLDLSKVARYIQTRLDEVESIFPKYVGTYNKRRVGVKEKGTYVNLSYHNSIEFRIAPLTFDYNTLLNWIIQCNKFVSKIISECHLNSQISRVSKLGNLSKLTATLGISGTDQVIDATEGWNGSNSSYSYYINEINLSNLNRYGYLNHSSANIWYDHY